jgi:hypothetical protein
MAATPLLGLTLPVSGTLAGTWGDTVNNEITSLLDTAVAGTTPLASDANVTLTSIAGTANQARSAILLLTGPRTALRTIIAPAQSKTYLIVNATAGGYGVKIVGAGPTTGVTIANGEKATIVWNGSDFVRASTIDGPVSGTTGTFTGAVSGTTGTFAGNVFGVNGTFTGPVSGTTGTFSGAVSGTTGTFSSAVSGTTGTFSGAVSGTTVTASGNVQMASANGGQLAGLRNKIINGDMRVAQRGTTFSLTATGAYTVDRWIAVTSVAASGTLTLNQTSVAITEGTSSNAAIRLSKTTGTFAGTLVAAQAFETSNSWGLAGKTVTISFKARKGSSYTGNALPYLVVVTGTGTDQSANNMLAGTWTGYTVSSTTLTGTLTTSMSSFSANTTIPASATQVGVQVGLTYATATTGSANDYLDITDVQLEVGPVATPFEQRPIGMELALCQRYYYRLSFDATVSAPFASSGFVETTTTAYASTPFPVTMRIAPTAVEQSGTAANYVVRGGGQTVTCSSVPTYQNTHPWGGRVILTTAAVLTVGQAIMGQFTTNAGYIGWSAEL